MNFRRDLIGLVASVSIAFGNFGVSSAQESILPHIDSSTFHSIVVDIPISESSPISRISDFIFDNYISDCEKSKKILAINSKDTTYDCQDSISQIKIIEAENLFDDDLLRLLVARTFTLPSISQARQNFNYSEIWRLKENYIESYGKLRSKYNFLDDSFFPSEFLDGF
ncbi:MAG TPA: hypothetical protein VJH92_05520 [Candidatus Nanoarchaeia archaeon]|nr:hypothetical protein [Candidatus Nanoarchaeia archaeon]